MDVSNGSRLVTLARESFTGRHLKRLRQLVLSASRSAGLTMQRSYHLVLAVNEAATNVIRHAGGSGQLEVLRDDQQRLIAVISDHGPGLPPGATSTRPDLDAAGGRGLWLIREVCDRVEFETDPTGTRVRLEMDLASR